MPLPEDQELVKVSQRLVEALKASSGKHPGYRPAHARGILLKGTFTPTPNAASLSKAQHFQNTSTPVTVRFSSSTGLPQIPDTEEAANPRGMAIRFHLGGRKHTDIIMHSTPFFPARTGVEFLEMLQALSASAHSTETPLPIAKFLGAHPSALAFVQAPKPFPASFARENYFGVTALKFISAEGKPTYFRYRATPEAGVEHLDEATLSGKSPSYLYDEMVEHAASGLITFRILAQIAEDGDATDDATVHWPNGRELAELGMVELDSLYSDEEQEVQQKYMIFDPIPRVEGIDPSDDPLLETRAAVYLISGRERRIAL